MGFTPLSQFLMGLCHDSRWNYAVFWKLQQGNEMLLTWEDGCYDHLKLRGSTESIQDYTCFNGSNEIFSSGWRSSGHDEHSGECSIEQAVADMACVQYRWGEGIVGEVAYTGNYCWVLCENIFSNEFESKVVPDFPYEWLVQFAAGIKTIVLVPVFPHGVLQLGVLEKVAEDQALVACIKDKFNAFLNGLDLLPLTSMEFQAQASSSFMPPPMDISDESSTVTVNRLKREGPKGVYGVKSIESKLSTTNQMMPVSLVQDPCYISGEEVPDSVKMMVENEFCFQSVGLVEVSKTHHQSLNDRESEMMEGGMVELSSLQEELQAFSNSDYYNMGLFGEHASVAMNSYSAGDLMGQTFEDKDADTMGQENVNSFISFPLDCELHKALGPCLLEEAEEYLWDTPLTSEDACYSSCKILNRDLSYGVKSSTWESSGCFAKTEDAEHLLAAVVPCMHSSLNDDFSNNSKDTKFSVTSSGQFATSTKAQGKSEVSAFVEEKKVLWSPMTTASGGRARNAVIKSPPASSFESMVSTLTEEKQQKKGYGFMKGRKGSKLSNAGKRRARPGENQKPRPRDRQLIQDRVKELRELVPNGSKCSIDGLLEKTIKHMLFLRSVTERADKLGQSVHQEVTGRKNVKSSGTKCTRQSGTSWAFELGSDFQVCPIVVEDLEQPGHMLIEMLCDDHGLFLEIAEVIRRFDFSILKGTMENRGSNTWAHFVVEASKGFHRLDIFWPLMQLLQRNQSPVSCKI